MHDTKRSRTYSSFFQIVVFFIILSLFTVTTVNADPDDSSGIMQLFQQLYTILFDSPSNSPPASSSGSSTDTSPPDSTVPPTSAIPTNIS